MSRGFIFNQTLCVNCKACSAACILENEFAVSPRTIFTINSVASVTLPVENLSIACNHCEIPVCMNGCPASAYLHDPSSGAIIVDDRKCIGCKYCIWNCPYDAPKYDPVNRVIGKCHLCYSRLEKGMTPACTDGCPTGALSFGNIDDYETSDKPTWFIGDELKPGFRLKGRFTDIPLRLVPELLFRKDMSSFVKKSKSFDIEWSLVIFSFMTMVSVSLMAASVIKGVFPDKVFFILLIVLPGLLSFFHLGKKIRFWRAVSNIKKSPLSREIFFYLVYVTISCFSMIYEIPLLLVISSVAGLMLLIIIDSVYIYSVKDQYVLLHSGQTFISSMLVISFISGSMVPFIFIAFIKLTLSGYGLFRNIENRSKSVIRFFRMALLLIAGASLVTGISYPESSVIMLLFTGECLDRILFYIDFEPNGLHVSINNQ